MSVDSPDISATHNGSHLLSMDTPMFPPESRRGPEAFLQISNVPSAGGPMAQTLPDRDDLVIEGQQGVGDESRAEPVQGTAQEVRDEKLKSDIFILQKLNTAFELFHEALEETGTANERVTAQVAETDALLNKYVNMLSKSEDFARLIFDGRWHGAEADEEEYILEKREEEDRARQVAAERVRKQHEEQRMQREKEEQQKREEREKIEREKSERAIRGSARGVRGTKASKRGATSSARAIASAALSRGALKRSSSSAIPQAPHPR